MATDELARLADFMPDATFILTGEGVVVAANRAVMVRLGVEPARLRGKRLSEFVTDSPEEVARYLHACSRSREKVLGTLSVAKDGGEQVPCRSEGALLRPRSEDGDALIMLRLMPKVGTASQFLVLNQKIEELGKEVRRRREAEVELREKEEWLRVTLSSIGDAVIATDTGGRVIFMNPVAEALTGWRQDEAFGNPLEHIFNVVNEETRDVVENPVTKALREGIIVGLANHTVLISRDGTEHSIEDTAAPIREEGKEVKGVVLIFHDIGERRQLERELQERAARLAENDRRKDEFLAMLAHELRNPLASINNAIHFFSKSEDTEEDLIWAKEVVERQVRHLSRLIDDLLDVSRITRGKISLRKEQLDLAPILNSAIEAVRPLIEERKHELNLSFSPGAMRLEADPLRLEQIFVNLLTNAAKYSDSGGRISLTATREGEEIVVKVRDTGVGILPAQLPRMFELFAQGDRTIARSEGGLGIGLTLVQKLVEKHGGTVSAHSDGPGTGSEFTVRLPAMENPAAEGPKSKATLPRVARQGSRVLVVDDNVDTARGLSKLLRLLGHDIQVAHDGPTAITLANAHRPEIMLLDIGLPGMDGFQVAQQLRKEAWCKGVLLIAVSGYGQEGDRRRSLDAGFDHHLVKPVDLDVLFRLMNGPVARV